MNRSNRSLAEQIVYIKQEKQIYNKSTSNRELKTAFGNLKSAIYTHTSDEILNKAIKECIERLQNQIHKNQNTSHIEQFINKEMLSSDFRKNKKVLAFLINLMDKLPSLAYKIIQKRIDILTWQDEDKLCLYEKFFQHAKQRRNNNLIENCIKEQIKRANCSLKRLKILLESNLKDLNQEQIKGIVKALENYKDIDRIKEKQKYINKLTLIKVFMEKKWQQGQIKQSQKIIQYLDHQIEINDDQNIEQIIYHILSKIQVRESNISKLCQFLLKKVNYFLSIHKDPKMESKDTEKQSLFKFLQTLFRKLEKSVIQQSLSQDVYEQFICFAIQSQLNQNVVNFLKIAKKKKIYSQKFKIQEKLLNRIQQMLNPKSNENKSHSAGPNNNKNFQGLSIKNNQFMLNPVKAIRIFNFDNLPPVFMIVRKGIFKNSLIEKHQFKRETIKTCMHMALKFESSKQSINLMKEVLKLTSNDPLLKSQMINWLGENQICQDSHIYDIYKHSQSLSILFHDYSSSQMSIRRNSIKVLCMVYPSNQCEIVPFLKKTYYQLYDRLSHDLADDTEKKQNLMLIREVIRYRTQIIKEDANSFAKFLTQQLQKQVFGGEEHSNSLIVQLLKTFSAMVEMLPASAIKHVRHVSDCLIHILQRKDLKLRTKKQSLNAFNQMIKHVGYVLIPYFHFTSLLPTISQLLKNDEMREQKNIFLKFLGGLGYMSIKKYHRMAIANKNDNNIKQIENCFKVVFGEINYLRETKQFKLDQQKKHIKAEQPFRNQLHLRNYKSYTIERIFHILTSNASQDMKNKCFEVLERLIYILMGTLGQQQEKCLDNIILPKIIKITDKKYLNKILSLLALITTHENINHQSLYQALSFLLHYHYHDEIVYETIYTITSKLNFKNQKDKIVGEMIKWLIKITKKQNNINENMIILTFSIIENISQHLDLYLHLFFPDYISAFMIADNIVICQAFLKFFLSLALKNSLQQFLPLVTAKLQKLIQEQNLKKQKNKSFIHKLVTFLIGLMIRFGDNFQRSVSTFHNIIKKLQIRHIFYDIAEKYMKNNNSLRNLHSSFKYNQLSQILLPNKLTVKQTLKKKQQVQQLDANNAFEAFIWQSNAIQQQSDQWFNRLAISLFQASNDSFLRTCSILAKQDASICFDMFPVGLYFFWISIQPSKRNKIFPQLEKILHQNTPISLRIKQKFLDTIFFLKQCNPQIAVRDSLMFRWSKQVWDISKALFYKQHLYESRPAHGLQLINMYLQLGQQWSAEGLLKIVKLENSKNKMDLFLSFGKFEEAKNICQQITTDIKSKSFQKMIIEILMKKYRLDWENAFKSCQGQDKNAQKKQNLERIAHMATQAAINMGEWDRANYWIKKVKQRDNLCLWQAMLKINEKRYDEAKQFIEEDRANNYPKICQLNNFSFQRYMQGILRLQQLCQLQQIIEFKLFESKAKENQKKRTGIVQEKKKKLIKLWKDRTQGFIDCLEPLQQILFVRSLLLDVKQNASSWVSLCHLALQKINGIKLCQRIVKKYFEKSSDPYRSDQNQLFDFKALQIETSYRNDPDDQKMTEKIKELIKQKHFLKMKQNVSVLLYQSANWVTESKNKDKEDLLKTLEKSVNQDKNNYKAWRLMGLIHMQIIDELKNKKNVSNKEKLVQKDAKYQLHTFQALKCFISSVSSTIQNHQYFMENCLKIMNIIFSQTNVPNLIQHLSKHIVNIPSQGLIALIPQIVGRLHVSQQSLLDIMTKLIVHIASNHPQAFIFPLIFLKRNTNKSRTIGMKIQNLIKEQQSKSRQNYRRGPKIQQLGQQGQTIVKQLCKVSLKLSQKFKIALSSQKLDQKKNKIEIIAKMILKTCQNILQEAQNELSLSQFGFIQSFRSQLKEICNYVQLFLQTKQKQFYHKALKIVSKVKQKLSSIDNIYKINLSQASPQLLAKKKSIVCIPGTYKPNQPNVYISKFKQTLQVIKSKQRPKKMVIQGSDGKQYNFLLKGKEDLRLDERIMQLVSLVNTMFDDPVQKQLYFIQGYSITPLSPQAGLIGWVENCDTMADLIINYRKQYVASDRTQFIEINISREMCPYYDNLPKYQKVEIFKQIQSMVSGQDLKNIFWLKANNTEQWLRFRSCYTRSLAVMSIVGYVIGLGDRHLKNILLQRMTGRIVHIDFGDCFDKNRMRQDFPERVPFRLTRMLVKAMEPFGVTGIFTHTCQRILDQLRKNSLIIMAIIQAFRYDPIIGWKLAKKDNLAQQPEHVEYEQHLLTQQSRLQDDQNQSIGPTKRTAEKPFEKQRQFALHIERQISLKLEGKTSKDQTKGLTAEQHTKKLIKQAQSPENLVQHYILWNIHW